MKKFVSVIIAVVLAVITIIGMPLSGGEEYQSHAEEVKATKYQLDIGAAHIWGTGESLEKVTWQDGNIKGGDMKVTVTMNFQKPVKEITAYPYSAEKFNWAQANKPNSGYTFNGNDYLKDQDSFDFYYSNYISSNISDVKAIAEGRKVTLSYTAKMNSLLSFDLKKKLNKGDFAFIVGVLGGESTVKSKYPEVYKRLEEGKAGKLPDTLYGFMYFTPIIIEYKSDNTNRCSVCGKCELVGDTKCTSKSCKNFGKSECGCYTDPVAQTTPPVDTSGDCKTAIKWSEVKSHSYKCGGCKTTSEGSKYCPGHTCNHVYTYQTQLSPSASLAASKPNGNSTTFKSGYGFSITMSNTISTSQVGNAGACGQSLAKANDKKPVPPTTAEVRTSWTVINKEKKKTQPKIIPLVKSSITATVSNFKCAPNVISHYNNPLIYTDVALKGTGKAPVSHTISVYSKGGGVNGVEFCGNVQKTFTINGNMYEDFRTVDGTPKI